MPSLRARSPSLGFSILTTSAPSKARCREAKGPERTLVRSRTLMPSRMRGFVMVPSSGSVGQWARLVDPAGQLAAEEGGDVPRHPQERLEVHVVPPAGPLQPVDQVLGGDVARGHLGEWAAAEAGE